MMLKKYFKLAAAVAVICAFVLLAGCSGGGAATETGAPNVTMEPMSAENPAQPGEVAAAFDFQLQDGTASNQFALWVEDAEGHFVKTIFATKFTASGGFQKRAESLPLWTGKYGIISIDPKKVDAVTGATPKTGRQTYAWDLTDSSGAAVPPGEYTVFIEGNLRWENRVLYKGTVTVGDEANTAQVQKEVFYMDPADEDALTAESPENAMIGSVAIGYTPAAE